MSNKVSDFTCGIFNNVCNANLSICLYISNEWKLDQSKSTEFLSALFRCLGLQVCSFVTPHKAQRHAYTSLLARTVMVMRMMLMMTS